MNQLTQFIKNLGISKEEKLLRKYGLKSEYGEYTAQAKEIMMNTICKERESEFLTIAQELEKEEKEQTKKNE